MVRTTSLPSNPGWGLHAGRIEKNDDGTLTVHYEEKSGKKGTIQAGVVMFGTGRKPNTGKLNVEVHPWPGGPPPSNHPMPSVLRG